MPFPKTYLISGTSRLPDGMAAKSLYDSLTVVAEVDAKHGVIISFSSTFANENSTHYLEKLLKGFSLKDGIEEPIQLLKYTIQGRALNSVISALKDLQHQYQSLHIPEKTVD